VAQQSVLNMEPQDTAVRFVKVRKDYYDKAMKVLSHQQSQLVQQEVKLKATENLFDLLQSKDAEVRQYKENVALLRAALDRLESLQQKMMFERLAAPPTQHSLWAKPSKGLQEDSVPSLALTNNDLEADSAELYDDRTCAVKRDFLLNHAQPKLLDSSESLKINSLAMPHNTVATSVQNFNTSLQNMSSCTVPVVSVTSINSTCSMPLPQATCSITSSSLVNSMPMQIGTAVSKDLVDKVMQQNARLKKAIRDILQQKGLSVSDYLVRLHAYIFVTDCFQPFNDNSLYIVSAALQLDSST